MISCRVARRWTLLLMLYVAADLMDPSIPGVFFFGGKELFVDGVIQVKSNSSRDLAATEPPMLFGGAAVYDDEDVAVKVHVFTRTSLTRQTHWKNVKHDDSASFASASPPSSSPDLPSS